METGYCLQCESLIDYATSAVYCSAKCMDEALGYSETGSPERRLKTPIVARIRGLSRTSSGHRSDSTTASGRRSAQSGMTHYDYTTSDVGYESTNPTTTTESMDDCADEDLRSAPVHFFPPRRLSVPSSPASRMSPKSSPRSIGLADRTNTYNPQSLLLPPARPRHISLLHQNRSTPGRDAQSIEQSDRPVSDDSALSGHRLSGTKKTKSKSRLSLGTSSAPSQLQAAHLKRKPIRAPQNSKGFFLVDDHHRADVAADASDADSELEPVSPHTISSMQRPAHILRRISSGMSGQRTPTGSRTVWSIAELSLDDTSDAEGKLNTSPSFMACKSQEDSSDEEAGGRRGRPRGLSRRISLGTAA